MTLPVRILLIEDNMGDARLLQEYLPRNLPFELDITHCERLARALTLLDRTRYDLILTDLFLPDSMGFSTFTKVQEKSGDTAIVILSGWDDQEQVTKALQHGARDYVSKSNLDAVKLVHLLRDVFKTNTARHASSSSVNSNPVSNAQKGAVADSSAASDGMSPLK